MMATITLGAQHWTVPVIGVGIAFLGLILWAYWRVRLPGVAHLFAAMLKIVAVLLLVLCLLEPLLSGVRPRPGANVWAILIDDSRSMQIPARGLPAGEQIRDWLGSNQEGWRADLEQNFDVRMYRFSRDLERLEDLATLRQEGQHTHLRSALEALTSRFENRPMAGALLLTDGNATDGFLADQFTSSFPIYPVLGNDLKTPPDLRLDQIQVSQSYFETSPTTVTADVVGTGYANEEVVVQLCDPEGKEIAQQIVTLSDDEATASVRFRFRPEHPGLGFYQLITYPQGQRERYLAGEIENEATSANNRRSLLVDRGGGPFRVLYVAGRPNWEFKFLRRALAEDEEIQLVGIVRVARKEAKFQWQDKGGVADANRLYQGFDAETEAEAEEYDQPVFVRFGVRDSQELAEGFPATAESLFAYDAIIIDDLEASFFSPDQMLLLRRYVSQRGGSLLMLGGVGTFSEGGYARTPLGELLPIYLSRNDATPTGKLQRLSLTREGLLESWTRLRSTTDAEQTRESEMPAFRTANAGGDAKPGAMIVSQLSDGDMAQPAMVTQRFGKGRSAAILVGDLWTWSMRRDDHESNDLSTFWRQSIRWLVADSPQRSQIEVLDENVAGGNVLIRVHVRDKEYVEDDQATVELTITSPDQSTFELEAEPAAEETGVYMASYSPQAPGGYRVAARVTTQEGEIITPRLSGWTAVPEEEEFQRVAVNAMQLERLAELSGGRCVQPDEVQDLIESLEKEPVPVTEQWVTPLWHQSWVFGIALFCLCAEWGIRRWKGLS